MALKVAEVAFADLVSELGASISQAEGTSKISFFLPNLYKVSKGSNQVIFIGVEILLCTRFIWYIFVVAGYKISKRRNW